MNVSTSLTEIASVCMGVYFARNLLMLNHKHEFFAHEALFRIVYDKI